MVKQFTREGVTFWSGTSKKFNRLVSAGELVKDRIYFVGDSDNDADGFSNSERGNIYVAVSNIRYVRFGDMTKTEGSAEIKQYPTSSQFPENGRTGVIYIASDTGSVYYWNGSTYAVIGGYTSGDGISIEGNEISNTHTNITDTEIDDICVTTETETPERNDHYLDNWGLKKLWDKIKNFFVQKENGKGLSTNDYTDSEKTKLAGIEQGAEVNVQSDWNQTDTSADDFIKNKPSVYTKTEIDNKLSDKQDTLTFDTTPTANSTNPVTSGGIKTALDAKQNAITVTTNTTNPNDNDTIIMQASGTTNTTTFIRRNLSYLWNWIRGKADTFYIKWNDFNMTYYPNFIPMTSDRLYDLQFDDYFFGAMDRFSVTGKIVDGDDQVIEEISSSELNKIFVPSGDTMIPSSLTEGNTLVININPSGSNTSLFNTYGKFYLIFSYQRAPNGTCTIKLQKTDDTWIEYEFSQITHKGNTILLGRVTNLINDITIKSLELRINGGVNSYNNTPGLSQFILLSYRNSGNGKVTRHAKNQQFYGSITAPKFIVPSGTNKQVLLANGTVATLPLSMGNGGTGATDWKGAEYNVNQRLRATEISTSINDNTLIPFLRDSNRDVTNGLFAGYRKAPTLWTYINDKAGSIYAHPEQLINATSIADYKNLVYNPLIDNALYAANERFDVSIGNYSSVDDLLLTDYSNHSYATNVFKYNALSSSDHPKNDTYDLFRIMGKNNAGLFNANQYESGKLIIEYFYTTCPDVLPEVKILTGSSFEAASWNTRTVSVIETVRSGRILHIADISAGANKTYGIEIKIIGKTIGNYGCSVSGLYYLSKQNTGYYNMKSVVTKSADTQDLYGNVIAPKFTVRGGTSKQILLANGDTINMPSTTGTNKDTLLKNLVSGLSNGTDDVTDETQLVTSYAGANGFNQSGAVNVAYKRQAVKMWNYIKSKISTILGIDENTASDIAKKTNRIIDHTWNQPSYSASASGTHVKICDIPTDCMCIMNVRKSVYGYPSINTLWIGNNNSLNFKSLTETDIVATVSGRICTLSVPAHTASGTPLHTYDFEISVLNKENLSAITWYDTATYYSPSRPTKPNVVMQQSAPVTDGSLAFNVNSSTHIASVNVDGYTDFVGMLTEDSESAVLVKLSDEEEGSVYRFTFDHAIEGGVSFSNSNASTVYCEVSQVIHAGDTITLTAVSNTSDGWIASVISAGIISSDNSVNIEWENGVADLKVATLPPNVVLNKAELKWEDDEVIAIGKGSSALCYSGDDNNPYAYTEYGVLQLFKVNGGNNEYYHEVTAGTTYSITVGSYTVSFTPDNSGYAIVCNLTGTRTWLIDGNHTWALTTVSQSRSFSLKDATVVGTTQYCLGVVNGSDCLTEDAVLEYWYKTTSLNRSIAIGNGAKANGTSSMAIGGYSSASGAVSIGHGSRSLANYALAIGYNARVFKSNAIAIGTQALSNGAYSIAIMAKALGTNAIAIGYDAQATANWSTAIGSQCKTNNNSYSVAMGYSAQTNSNYATAIGESCQANGSNSIALGAYGQANGDSAIVMGRYAKVGYKTNDADYPQYKSKRFNAVSFTEDGIQKYYRFLKLSDSPNTATITVNGTTIELTPPNGNVNFFIVVNDSSAPLAYRNIGPYMLVDKTDKYITNSDTRDIAVTQISGNYYAMWLYGYVNDMPQTVSSISLLAYVKSTVTLFPSESYAIGYEAIIMYSNCIAMGRGAICAREGQIILGSYCVPNEKDRLIIGGGGAGNTRKNILTIDDNEVMHVRGIVNEVRTIETGGTSASVTQIKQGVIKVTGGGSLELSTTGAVEGLSVKVYASGANVMMPDFSLTITAGMWHEFIFLDGAWHSQM